MHGAHNHPLAYHSLKKLALLLCNPNTCTPERSSRLDVLLQPAQSARPIPRCSTLADLGVGVFVRRTCSLPQRMAVFNSLHWMMCGNTIHSQLSLMLALQMLLLPMQTQLQSLQPTRSHVVTTDAATADVGLRTQVPLGGARADGATPR